MKLTFLGAAGTVTGSSTVVKTNSEKYIIVDYGMFQGRERKKVQQLPNAVEQIDAIVLTHAHIDHIGHLPMLIKEGYRGKIYCTAATARLAKLLLLDCAHIQKTELTWKNKKLIRAGKEPEEAKYDETHVATTLELIERAEYKEPVTLTDDITLTFEDAGHLLGSSVAALDIKEGDSSRRLVFSGDLGNDHRPLMCDPTRLDKADCVVLESTYGGRSHGEDPDTKQELFDVVRRTFARGGKVIIPAFAVGRTQELLYHLRELYNDDSFKQYGNCPVFVDSPLAVEATKLFEEYADSYFDEETHSVMRKGEDPIIFDELILSVTTDESRAINAYKKSCIIISASGMCDAGRIKHHLKHNLYNSKNSVLFVGYQAEHTLGRKLLEGARRVNIFGESVSVRAEIVRISGISAHADHDGLLNWLSSITPPPRVILNHGSPESSKALAEGVKDLTGTEPVIAELHNEYEPNFDTGAYAVTAPKTEPVVEKEKDLHSTVDEALTKLVAIAGKLGYLSQTDIEGERADIEKAVAQIDKLWELLKQDEKAKN